MAKREHKPSKAGRRLKDAEVRVDPAHVLGDAPLSAPPALASTEAVRSVAEAGISVTASAEPDYGPGSAVALVQRVRSQAGQLADHLRRQQTSLDHRESELNARESHVESQVRSARLWLRERQEDMQSRQTDLDRRERELAAREERIRAAEHAAKQPATAERRESSPRNAQQNHAPPIPAPSQQPGSDERLRRRVDELDAAEKLLVREQAELDQARAALFADREAWESENRAERRGLAELERGLRIDAKRQEESLQQRWQQLEARGASLESLREETSRTQRDTLEMRLATEEVWARLAGQVPPAELAHSLALVRLKLADEQRLTAAALAEKRRELEDLSTRVAQRHEQLVAERAELTAWRDRRQSDLAQQAAALLAQEAELAQRSAQVTARSDEWTAERRRLQAEIRRLLKELRGVSLIAR